jgi:hypothetical protein
MTALLMEAIRTSETSIYSNENTRRYIPEGSNLHTRRRENLKSHTKCTVNCKVLGLCMLKENVFCGKMIKVWRTAFECYLIKFVYYSKYIFH